MTGLAPFPQYHCGGCALDFGSNCYPDDIACPECGARLCPHCKIWFGGEFGEVDDSPMTQEDIDAHVLDVAQKRAAEAGMTLLAPPDFHRLVELALAVSDDDAAFVERMRAASEGGQ